jgi:prepilin-type N-terminal cleavage/methylation domain-containing protein/prepilin-type processing-associated H-X9-DG protein
MHRSPFRRRNGFTLVELLVVIAIIAVLAGLLLPAVQKVRAAAARAQCQNNLKQLGLGIHSWHDAKGYIPQNHRPASAQTTTVRERWLTRILPFIDQSPLYSQYDDSSDWDSSPTTTPPPAPGYPGNIVVTSVPLKIVQCPAAAEPSRQDNNPAASTPEGWGPNNPPIVAVTDYAGIYGVHPSFSAATGIAPANPYGTMINDTFKENSRVTLTDITDGTSNTILLAESAGRPQLYNQGGVRQGLDLTQHGVNGGGWARPASEIWLIGFQDRLGTIPGGPFTINAANGVDTQGVYPLTTPIGFPLGTSGSGQIFGFHAGGANSVFADGSVHLLADDISAAVIAALVTRANNDVVPALP